MSQTELDATGLKCPLPVLKARKVMKSLNPGDVLVIRTTDPGSPADLQAFCDAQGHEMRLSEARGDEFYFEVCKG